MIEINKLIMDAMKSHDKVALETYKLIKAKILEFKTAKNAKEYNEQAEIQLLSKMIKERKDSICIYLDANRGDLADEEWAQVHVLEDLLPKEATEEEIKNWLISHYPNGIDKKDRGSVMQSLKSDLKRIDGKLANTIISGMLK